MKRFFMSLLAIFTPWLVFFINDNPGAGIITLIMQVTLIGWIPASIWAWGVVKTNAQREQRQKKEAKRASPPE